MNKIWIPTLLILFAFLGCSNDKDGADAYGNFETTEVIVSAEASGKIIELKLDEGVKLTFGEVIGSIDTTQLVLKRDQLLASIQALKAKLADVQTQVDVLEQQKENVITNKTRIEKLYKDSAATKKQLDDITSQLDVINKQIVATRTQLSTQNRGILAEQSPLEAQIAQINDQISKSIIKSPIKGTIIEKYVEQGEFATTGKPLFKIADLENMNLRAYVSGTQLPNVKIGQKVKVLFDKNKTENQSEEGEIIWISDKSEFTPKIIQTKEERVNLVYAIKVRVHNDGRIKIGMPGEVKF